MKKLHLIALALCSSSTFAATINVNDQRDLIDTNLNDDVCETEFQTCSLRAAIQTANRSNEKGTIELPAGIYQLSLSQFGENNSVTGDLDIYNDITINGIGNPTIDALQLDRHFDIHGSNKNSRLELNNLTLFNGKSFEEHGGSIKASSNLSLNNVTLSDNTNDNENIGFGGAIYVSQNSSANIIDSVFSQNKANMGGAIFNEGYTFVTGTEFNNNESQLGGAVYNESVLSINDSTLSENSSRLGGAIFNEKFFNSSINIYSENTSNLGGAIYNELNTELFSFEDTLSENNANNGAAFFNLGELDIYNTYVINNAAESNGGFLINNGVATILASTIEGNTADNGGAVYNQETVEIINTTLLGNTGSVSGGIIHNEQGTTELRFSTALNNSINNIAPIFSSDGSFSYYGSLFLESPTTPLCETLEDDATLIQSQGQNTLSAIDCNNIPEDTIEQTITNIVNTPIGKVAIPDAASASIDIADECIGVDATGAVREITLCDAGAFETDSEIGNPGTISFELENINAPENSASNNNNTIQIPVFRTDGTDGPITANYQTIGINTSTTEENDFTMTSGTLKWEHKDADTKYINLVINDDLKIEGDEQVSIVLTGSNLSTNYSIVTVNIQDNDTMRGTFSFEEESASIVENGGLEVIVTRSEYSQGEVEVEFEIIDTTNINTSEILTDVNSLTFEDGQTTASVNINIEDNETYEPSRSFKIKLSDSDNTVKLGETKEIHINVNEDELVPTYGNFSISAPDNVTEGSTNSIIINRASLGGYLQGEVSFTLSSSNELINLEETEITFSSSDDTREVKFSVVDDNEHNSTQQTTIITQTITSFTGGEVYAQAPITADSATLNIIDNDAAPDDGTYSFSVSELTFETEGLTKDVQIIRTGGANGTDTIIVEVLSGTATENDIELSSFSFIFEEGETEKTLSIKSVIDNEFEAATENLSIRLRTNEADTMIGDNNTLELTLNDGLSEEDNTLSSKSGSTGILMLLSMLSLSLLRRFKI